MKKVIILICLFLNIFTFSQLSGKGKVISIKDGMECTEEEINEYCMKLPRYKRPKKLIFADVPRNATGKIEKPALRKKYGAEYLVAQQNRA